MFAYCNNNPVASADPSGEYGGHQPIMVNDGADSIVSLLKAAAKYYTKDYARFANCYAFAFNLKVDPRTGEVFQDRPQPGEFAGMSCRPVLDSAVAKMKDNITYTSKDLSNIVIDAVTADGHKLGFSIESVDSADCPANAGQWVVALAFSYHVEYGQIDYHWWRRIGNGYWFHIKMDPPVLATDSSGNAIYDPQTCNRGEYTVWGGYYLVTPTN